MSVNKQNIYVVQKSENTKILRLGFRALNWGSPSDGNTRRLFLTPVMLMSLVSRPMNKGPQSIEVCHSAHLDGDFKALYDYNQLNDLIFF